jgi:isoleucyl-tRNA synthetase
VFQTVVDFCANELSAQYFDIQKDTLYTQKKDGVKRRSSQTALYRIAKELLVVLAPVTSFTSEEAYEYLPGAKAKSVFLEAFPKPKGGVAAQVVADFDALFQVRAAVLAPLEVARRDKLIGKSVEAKVIVTASGATHALLTKYASELAEFFIVSQVELVSGTGEVSAKVEAATGNKCPRCWTYKAEVGAKEVCDRCAEALG